MFRHVDDANRYKSQALLDIAADYYKTVLRNEQAYLCHIEYAVEQLIRRGFGLETWSYFDWSKPS